MTIKLKNQETKMPRTKKRKPKNTNENKKNPDIFNLLC